MSWDPIDLVRRVGVVALTAFLCHPAFAQNTSAPEQQLVEAERLAWLKAWTKAEPLYTAAEREFAARGDKRNALYAQINALRGQLPRLPVPVENSASSPSCRVTSTTPSSGSDRR